METPFDRLYRTMNGSLTPAVQDFAGDVSRRVNMTWMVLRV